MQFTKELVKSAYENTGYTPASRKTEPDGNKVCAIGVTYIFLTGDKNFDDVKKLYDQDPNEEPGWMTRCMDFMQDMGGTWTFASGFDRAVEGHSFNKERQNYLHDDALLKQFTDGYMTGKYLMERMDVVDTKVEEDQEFEKWQRVLLTRNMEEMEVCK